MASLVRWAKTAFRLAPLTPLRVPSGGFDVIAPSEVLEEERFPEFKAGVYCPVTIGGVVVSKYQVVGQLGFGVLSTVWLARDLEYHFCLVQRPIWGSFRDRLYRDATHRFTEELLKTGLSQIFLALDYLHTECKLVHAADNVLQEITKESILEALFAYGNSISVSRRFRRPRTFGRAVLYDFGSAAHGDVKNDDDVQPNVYRSPEVMLHAEWSYPIDIWNVGIWDLIEGKHMFYGNDPTGIRYSTRAHLAEVVGLLGLPPTDLLKKGKRSDEFFTEQGERKIDTISVPQDVSLDSSEQFREGESKKRFLRLMRSML
ncbi:kinase-like domain-containing protein [Thelonectria olida]|uniref:non-specific serine/threonine protein kinase n=1 Tax=Thelonectria olida TaxID=1576542 RepID=A0A9P8W1W9_9HYPO|nr:kinase-like domain-containing protein [Thelonectria olida]